MLRGFRHTLFLLLQVGVLASAALALFFWPKAWEPIAVCTAGSLIASLACERVARRYLKRSLGRLRRTADDLGHGRPMTVLETHPGDDFYKIVTSINLVAQRLEEASREGRRLQDELRRRERLAFLGELAASVAHEVNNPLDGVQNCARILRRCLDDPQRARQMLDLIDGGLSRIELIVRRLLTLARENVIRPAPARLSDVLEAAIKAAGPTLTPLGVRLQRSYIEEDRALVDELLLEQVFMNLLLNAADSMPRGGDLSLSIRRESSIERDGPPAMLVVEVADSGTGIARGVLPHIFEPFFTTKQGGKGTGLGLPIAARIVDAHRGSIEVQPRPDGGTVFAVRLPAPADPASQSRLEREWAPVEQTLN